MKDNKKDCVYVTMAEFMEWMGMTGVPIRLWVDDSNDYVFLMTVPEPDDPNGQYVSFGGVPEHRRRGFPRHD